MCADMLIKYNLGKIWPYLPIHYGCRLSLSLSLSLSLPLPLSLAPLCSSEHRPLGSWRSSARQSRRQRRQQRPRRLYPPPLQRNRAQGPRSPGSAASRSRAIAQATTPPYRGHQRRSELPRRDVDDVQAGSLPPGLPLVRPLPPSMRGPRRDSRYNFASCDRIIVPRNRPAKTQGRCVGGVRRARGGVARSINHGPRDRRGGGLPTCLPTPKVRRGRWSPSQQG